MSIIGTKNKSNDEIQMIACAMYITLISVAIPNR